ncbi:MAG: BMP family ABC transporter substrate-binding protein [Oscillospiraceae bacterium]|jgi:basic membrane protein A|nr:BMP family ABC transporter substrate-binding protein [Oscillospiraceae bacterium]
MKKKILPILVSLLLIGAMVFAFAACDFGKDTTPTTTDPPAATTPVSGIAAKDIKIGVLHIADSKYLTGYTGAHQRGILAMVEELGLDLQKNVFIQDQVDDVSTKATNEALQKLVDDGCNVIFATSYNYMDKVEKFAKDYPDILFSHCSGYKSNGTNFNNYFGAIYEARYLAGIAAGEKLKAEGKKIAGYVAAQDVTNAEVTGGVDAWALGIQSVVPDAKVLVSVTGTWYNDVEEGKAAKALISKGATVIGQHCDTENPQLEAANAGVFGVGYNTDMTIKDKTDKSHIIAPVWNWGVYYTATVKSVLDGTAKDASGKWKVDNYFGNIKDGLIGLSPLNAAIVPEGTQEKIDAAKAKIVDGSLVIFDKGVTFIDKNGKEVVLDKPLTVAEITGGKLEALKDTDQTISYIKGVELA